MRGAAAVQDVPGRTVESFHLAQAIVGAQAAFHQGKHEDLEDGAVIPVTVALGVVAVGAVADHHRRPVGLDGLADDPAGRFRIGFEDGKRSADQAAVADLVPVVLAPVEPGVLIVQRGVEGIFLQRPDYGLARRGLQPPVQPVVSDGDGGRHLADVQEVRRVPVGKGANVQDVLFGVTEVFFVAGETPGVGAGEDAGERLPRFAQDAPAAGVLLIDEGIGGKRMVSTGHAGLVQQEQGFVVSSPDGLLQFAEARRVRDQPGMPATGQLLGGKGNQATQDQQQGQDASHLAETPFSRMVKRCVPELSS